MGQPDGGTTGVTGGTGPAVTQRSAAEGAPVVVTGRRPQAPDAGAPEDAGQPGRSARRSWAAVATVALGTFALVSTEFLPVGMLDQIASGLRVSPGTAGLLVTVPGLAAAVSSPLLTVGARRADRRVLLLALGALLVVSDVLSALAPTFGVLLVARLLLGLALGGFWSIGLSLAVRLVGPQSAGRATAVVLAGISAGTLFGVPAGSLIGDRAGWRTAFWIVAVLAALALLAQLRLVPPVPVGAAVHGRDLVAVLSDRATQRVLVAVALAVGGQFAAYSYVTPYLTEVAGLDAPVVAGLLLAYAVAGFAGNAFAGATVGRHVRGTALAAAVAIAAATALLVPLRGSGAAVAVLLVLWGLGFGALPAALQTWAYRLTSARIAEGGAAVLVLVFQGSIAVGSVAGGRVVDGAGLRTDLIAAALVLTAAAAVVLSSRTPPPAEDAAGG